MPHRSEPTSDHGAAQDPAANKVIGSDGMAASSSSRVIQKPCNKNGQLAQLASLGIARAAANNLL
jgi:hypothetical protein